MHITVVCPSCQNTYQVDSTLQGRFMRCPNPLCREAFEVRALDLAPLQDATDPAAVPEPREPPRERPPAGPPVPPRTMHQTGSVGDVIPILAAEEAIQAKPPVLRAEPLPPAELPPSVEAPSWHQPPPVRRQTGAATPGQSPSPERRAAPPATQRIRRAKPSPPPRTERRPEPPVEPAPELPAGEERGTAATMPDVAGQPVELPPGAWEPPPVRRSADRGETAAVSQRSASSMPDTAVAEPEPLPGSTARRRARWMMAGIFLTVVAILGTAGWYVWTHVVESESRDREQAQRDYQEGRFRDAAERYQKLAERYSTSPEVQQYQFLSQLSQLRFDLQGVGADPQAQLDKVSQFLKTHVKDPLLKEHGPDLGKSLVRLLGDYATGAVPVGDRSTLPILDRAEQLLAEMDQRIPGSISAADREKLGAGFQAVRAAVDVRERRGQYLARLQELQAAPSAAAVKEAHQLIKQATAELPGFDRDMKVMELLVQLYEGHRHGITFTPAGQPSDLLPAPVEPSLLVEQLVTGQPAPSASGPQIVFALARGVLYALDQRTGDVRWAMRVGIDTTALPIRLPPTLANPELFLVLSADTNTLTALDVDGERQWQYRLTAPCLGRPVIVDQRAFVPTYDGQVHEIEVVRGHLLGRYNLGQRLSVGGARQPGTHLLYFPADDFCIYTLNADPRIDPARRKCEAILYSEHPSGSLRSEPLLTSWDTGPASPSQGYMILSQTHGLDAMQLQVYGLPLQDPNTRPLAMQPQPQTRGWTWFSPYHDPEKLALATDAGVLDLFGIRQLRNLDNPLFRFLHEEMRVGDGPGAALVHRGRSQVVHVQENDFWVLARGRLQRLQLTFDRRIGPKMAPVWEKPLTLGSPLHSSQVIEPAEGTGLGLMVVTQSLGQQTCLATMVDAEDGKIRWQRQLGLVCQGEPVRVGEEVLAADQGGGLFRFDPRKHAHHMDVPWQLGGQSVAGPVEDSVTTRPHLLRSPDGKSAYEVATTGKGMNLVVRRYEPGPEDKKGRFVERTLELRAALAGAPALSADSMLLPLTDGSLVRVHLPLDSSPGVDGPDWRASRAPLDLQPYVVWFSESDFLTTDGGRGLTRWRWPRGGVWQALPKEKDPRNPTIELPARIVAAPVVLRTEGQAEPRICVTDAEGNLVLLQVKGEGLEVARRWSLQGKITAGPFVQGAHIACIVRDVDSRRLVWLNPSEDQPVWQYHGTGEEFVGQPQLIDNLLVVADQSGYFVGLDPATGLPRGPGYRLKANVAPATSPVVFGPNRAFAPLTDGTVLLLSLDLLRDPLRKFPLVW